MIQRWACWGCLVAVCAATSVSCHDFGVDQSEQGSGGQSGTGGAPSSESGGASGASGDGSGGDFTQLGEAGTRGSPEQNTGGDSSGGDSSGGDSSGGDSSGGDSSGGDSNGGAAGDRNLGAGGAWQTSIFPGCNELDAIPLHVTPALPPALCLIPGASGFAVFTGRQSDNAISHSEGRLDNWGSWQCFGYVPEAASPHDADFSTRRMVAANMGNGFEQVFVVTGDGKVFWKQRFPPGWGAFFPFNLPAADSFVTDLSVSPGAHGHIHVYVVDRGRIFVRYNLTGEYYAPFGGWTDIGPSPGGMVVTAATLPDGRQEVFALDEQGAPFSLEQKSAALGSSFGAWKAWSGGTVTGLRDLDVSLSASGALRLFAMPKQGNILTSEAISSGVFAPWHAWDGPLFTHEGWSITAVSQPAPGKLSMMFVADADGTLSFSQATGNSWSDWLQFY